MFGIKKTAVIEPILHGQSRPLRTPEYILQNTASLQVGSEEIKKRMAISSVASHHYAGGLTLEIMERLQTYGFRIFVKSDFVDTKNFPYYALLRGKERCCYNQYLGSAYIYAGDVPTSVVGKAQAAIEQGINYLTIHSRQPLPLDQVMKQVDPILIGWVDNPNMYGRWANDGGNLYRNSFSIGVLIAVWDNDKELEL